MFSSLAVALALSCFAAVIIVVLAARTRTTNSIARVLYDAEHDAKTR
ncbi:MAG TPA: hypothetical protein VNK41_03275 [Vicinamibacterales bacterium]|nr:hypothetical protein [Vicinamibacterales bacterium]